MKRFLVVIVALRLAAGGATAAQALTQKVTYPDGPVISFAGGLCKVTAYSTEVEDHAGVTDAKSGAMCDYVRVRVHYNLNSWSGYSNWTTDPGFAYRPAPNGSYFNQSQHGADNWH